MSPEQHKAVVRRFVEEVRNRGNYDALHDLVVPERVADFRKQGEALRDAFAGYHVAIEDLIAEGDRVVLRASQRGIHRGTFLGVPATGREVTWGVIRIFRFVDGRIAETWFASEQQSLLQQFGAGVSS